jgi:hypothetical protein
MEIILGLIQRNLSFTKIKEVVVLRSMVHQGPVIVVFQGLELLLVTVPLCLVVVVKPLLVLSTHVPLRLTDGVLSHCHLHRVLHTDLHSVVRLSEDQLAEKIAAIIVLNMILGDLMF